MDSKERELRSTSGTLGERRCDSAQILLEKKTCWISKGNLCNVFQHCSEQSIMFYAGRGSRDMRREDSATLTETNSEAVNG